MIRITQRLIATKSRDKPEAEFPPEFSNEIDDVSLVHVVEADGSEGFVQRGVHRFAHDERGILELQGAILIYRLYLRMRSFKAMAYDEVFELQTTLFIFEELKKTGSYSSIYAVIKQNS